MQDSFNVFTLWACHFWWQKEEEEGGGGNVCDAIRGYHQGMGCPNHDDYYLLRTKIAIFI